MQESKRRFTWDAIGDIAVGRPHLGPMARLEMYRLMQFSLRRVLEERLGADAADQMVREAGQLAGEAFAERWLEPVTSLSDSVRRLQALFREYGIGIVRMEEADPEKGRFVFTVEEDMDCSGLPEADMEICKFDEGFLAGILERSTGRRYRVTEVDCWCSGERICRFVAEAVSDP